MMLAQTVGALEIVVVLVYLMAVGYLGWLGYRRTKTAADYMVAGRKTHPFVMAMSYGATFISTSAIVGFGGVAGLFGMSLLWLTFLNIFAGIFIAFVFLGGPTRRMGHSLDAHTFPELLGRRYQSLFIQVFAGLVIAIFIPLYSAAVLIGGTEFITTAFGLEKIEHGYEMALMLFSVLIAAYVVVGGLKGVMYTDALQGTIMFIGMTILIIFTYAMVGGVVTGHEHLASLADLVPAKFQAMGHQGWSAMPDFGWGDARYDLWWIIVGTIVMGVGIGVLAQPQLVVRFMTVKSKRELNRAVLIGGIFILIMTGVAFTVGSLSNVYFSEHGEVYQGKVANVISEEKGHVVLQTMKKTDTGWIEVTKEEGGKQVPIMVPVLLDKDQPTVDEAAGIKQGRSIAIVYAKGNPDQIIPTFITTAMPKWFGLLFLLTLLAAAMSTLSSQFHTLGTSIGRDVFETIATRSHSREHPWSVLVVRIGIIVGIVVAALFSAYARGGYIIARATAIFFGLCASAFLPAFVGGLFWKRMTKAGAIASMLVGFVVTAFWLVFIKAAEAKAIGLVQWVTGGKDSLLAGVPNWPVVDPLFVALPLSILTAIVVSLATKPPADDHIHKCFAGARRSR